MRPASHPYSPLPTHSDADPPAASAEDHALYPPEAPPESSFTGLPTHWDHQPSVARKQASWARAGLAGLVVVAFVLGLGLGAARHNRPSVGAGRATSVPGATVTTERPAVDAEVASAAGHFKNAVGSIVSSTPATIANALPTCAPAAPAPAWNVNPSPKPVPPCASATERFLSYENHSGFHNQRSGLTNALLLSKLLNRTLLLPPARAGLAIPWTSDLRARRVPFAEQCKARNSAALATGRNRACARARPDKWTYIGWDWIFGGTFLKGFDVVDRWNGSQAWIELPRSEGGLGLRPDEIRTFADTDRRSYQLYDSSTTADKMGSTWKTRINIPDLLAPEFAEKKLLQFGSLFGGQRVQAALPETRRVRAELDRGMILSEPGLEDISDDIRERLGNFVGVHLRIGDGWFARSATASFPTIFRNVAEDVLGLPSKQVDRLLAASQTTGESLQRVRHRTLLARSSAGDDDGGDDGFHAPRQLAPRATSKQIRSPSGDSDLYPLSPSLICRGTLHPPDSPLAVLNTPIFIATDAHNPTTMPPFLPFFQHLPCLFTLDDFAAPSLLNQQQPVAGLARLAGGEPRSDWDGLPLGPFVFGFVDAMTAAKGDAFVGTPGSTFSRYVERVLYPYNVGRAQKAGVEGMEK